ncbi:DUF4253 domain-containing protein [Kitasatospora sp. NE20-6]|uniref:DUF4253 domain-containing protein n=1 Tax=Kitasatospora sp. NE20-6 TaxID=2859066 RepID=UPI0038B3B1CB
MNDSQPPSCELRRLFAGGAADHLDRSTLLPPGRLIGSDEGGDATPVMWMSEGPAPAGLWEKLRHEHAGCGLWPLLLAPLGDEPDFRPWGSQELYPQQMSSPGRHDAAALLRGWWRRAATDPTDDPQDAQERQAMLAPLGPAWPGLAPSPALEEDPDTLADTTAARLLRHRPELRIGLVRADSGAEALAACGWSGPCNHDETGTIAAVLRSWEQRFGTRVVKVGFDTLHLSVAAPPTDLDEALLVAAEHVALCPDIVFQGTESLTDYAQELIDEDCWSFWWD